MFHLAVGFKPEGVHFSDDGRLVLFSCLAGLSAARLSLLDGDAFLPPIPLASDPFAPPRDREIAVTPNGQWAVSRDLVAQSLRLVAIEGEVRRELPLPDWASDLDLTPDGQTAVVPFVSAESVALIDIPAAFLWEPTQTTTRQGTIRTSASCPPAPPFGSAAITGDGDHVLLVSTAPTVEAIGMLDLAAAHAVLQPIVKPITGCPAVA